MSAGFLLLAALLLGSAVGIVLWGLWMDWWVNRALDRSFTVWELVEDEGLP